MYNNPPHNNNITTYRPPVPSGSSLTHPSSSISSSLSIRSNVNIGLGSQYRTLKEIIQTNTKMKKINLFGIVVSSTFKKVCSNGNNYRSGYSIIDDTLIPDISSSSSSSSLAHVQPVVVQFFAPDDLNAHPHVVSVGDIIRIHRADIDIFGGKVQANVPTHFGGYIDVFHPQTDGKITVTRTINVPTNNNNNNTVTTTINTSYGTSLPTNNPQQPSNGTVVPSFLRTRIPFTSLPLPEQARVKKLLFWWNIYRTNHSILIPRDHYSLFENFSSTAAAYGQGDRYIDSIACVVGISEPLQQIIRIMEELDKYSSLLLQYNITNYASLTKVLTLPPINHSSSSTTAIHPNSTNSPITNQELYQQLTVAYEELTNFYSNPHNYLQINPFDTDYSLYIWDTTDNGTGNGYRRYGIEVPLLNYAIENNSTVLTNEHCLHQGLVLRIRIDIAQIDLGMLQLKIGTWIRLRNIKIRFDNGPPGYESTFRSSSSSSSNSYRSTDDTKAYLGENSGILRIDQPEKYSDIISLLLNRSTVPPQQQHYVLGSSSSTTLVNPTSAILDPVLPSTHLSNHESSVSTSTITHTYLPPSSSTVPASASSSSSSSSSTSLTIVPDIHWITKVLVPEIPLWNIKNIVELLSHDNIMNNDKWNTLPRIFRVRTIVFAVRPFDYREFCQPKSLLLLQSSSSSSSSNYNTHDPKRIRYENDTVNRCVTLNNHHGPGSHSTTAPPVETFPSPPTVLSSSSSSPLSSENSPHPSVEQQWALDELPYDTEYFYYFALRLRDIEAGGSFKDLSPNISSSSVSSTSSSTTYPMIDGIVFGEDGEIFLPGLPPCNLYENDESAENLRIRTKELFRPNTAMECCLKMYRIPSYAPEKCTTDKNNNNSSSSINSSEKIRFRIFKTVLLLPNTD